MKILQINKFYHEKGKSGGTGRYLFSLIQLLESRGHQIEIFSMQDENTLSSPYSPYFVKKQDFSTPKISLRNLGRLIKFIYSFEAKRNIKQLIKNEKPDIVHIHNIYHHITPSILSVLKKYHLPVVQTLHDFHLISPNYNLFFKNSPHETCSHGKYWKAIVHKCIKNSRFASMLVAVKMYFEKISRVYLKNVDFFIAPSEFLKKKYLENKFPAQKIIAIKPFVDAGMYLPNFSPGNYALYFGRLHAQKGLDILIDAFRELPHIPLKIVGTGEEKENLLRLIKKEKINNIELVGPKYGKQLEEIIKNSAFVIVPSLSYENAPFAVLESFALGKPVIASNLGGLPELIKDNETGLLFNAGDKKDLKEKILKLYQSPWLIKIMGHKARLLIEQNFSPNTHYQALMAIYQRALIKKL